MKVIKIIAAILLGAIVLIVLVGLILPKEMNLEREIVIEAPVDTVFPMVSDFRNFVSWSPWSELDPEAEVMFEGPMSQVGATYHWSGNEQVGKGYMEILRISTNDEIDLKLVFVSPWESVSDVYYKFENVDAGTKVVWGYTAQTPFPMNIFMKFMGMEKMLGHDYDKGLSKLKMLIEGS